MVSKFLIFGGIEAGGFWFLPGVTIRYDPVLLEKYNTVLSHCGSSKKAIVATARKLAMRLRAVLISGEPYQVGLVECVGA